MEKTVYLVGHGNLKLSEFLQILTEKGINMLIDVRSVPFSKYVPDFNKESLKEFLSKNDIEYAFMGSILGGRHPQGFNKYMDSDEFKKGIEILKEEIIGRKAAIMCSEINHNKCHRRFIGSNLADEGFDVEYIGNGKSEKVNQRTILSF